MVSLLLIRHGEATHNVDFDNKGEIAYCYPIHSDSKLTDTGIAQASNIIIKENIDLILVSPLTRAITTCIFSNINIKINKTNCKSCEYIREFPSGKHYPNKRKSKTILSNTYRNIDFKDLLHDEDKIWKKDIEESLESLDKRIHKFIELINQYYIYKRTNKIVVFTHASFISRLLKLYANTDIKNVDIEHCKPYYVNV